MSVGILGLRDALRELQIDYELDVVSATKLTPLGRVTIKITGVQSPIGVLEDERGNTVAINVP